MAHIIIFVGGSAAFGIVLEVADWVAVRNQEAYRKTHMSHYWLTYRLPSYLAENK
jgi:hypothetical protein